ncbi:beta-lactamase-like protein [Aspergillus sergii]|uniref:Beta-lactamase-like protein n=1 Tax=Aspergillus sergii TaxID=1034303 RepID=A0A5N6X1A7_9EURO|nr:beta-lactamase-like protein [Aspergillus sergii]
MDRSINKLVNLYAFEDYLNAQVRSLPELPEVDQVSPRVFRLLGGNPGHMQLQGTNTYLVGTGNRRILIDTGQGIPLWINHLEELLSKHDITISQVLLTHWHGDHTGGVPDLLRLHPELKESIYKCDPDTGQKPIVDRQIFRVEGATIHALFTPGHSTDHMCFFLEEENALFTGDNILGHGTTAVEDLSLYMASLGKMQHQSCEIGYPGHGQVIWDLRRVLQAEIGRKHRRERQVIAGLKALQLKSKEGAAPRELVSHVFGALPEEVVDHVFEPFMKEVLMKLAVEKRVGFRFKSGHRVWFAKG